LKRSAIILKLADGQFENVKIKVQIAKLRNPPGGGWLFYDIYEKHNVLSKLDLHLTFATNRSV
jgi:hypothetical protein